MIVKVKHFLSVYALLVAAPALAAPACYSPAELEAEQLLRLHSELMVITVTCRVGSGGESLTTAYTGFTNRNISALHQAERAMVNYYDEHGGQGQDRLDKLRTKLANEYGQKIADMSAQPFCDAYRDKVLTFNAAASADVQAEVTRMEAVERSYAAPCESTTRIAKQAR